MADPTKDLRERTFGPPPKQDVEVDMPIEGFDLNADAVQTRRDVDQVTDALNRMTAALRVHHSALIEIEKNSGHLARIIEQVLDRLGK
jgi:hypothetical protein